MYKIVYNSSYVTACILSLKGGLIFKWKALMPCNFIKPIFRFYDIKLGKRVGQLHIPKEIGLGETVIMVFVGPKCIIHMKSSGYYHFIYNITLHAKFVVKLSGGIKVKIFKKLLGLTKGFDLVVLAPRSGVIGLHLHVLLKHTRYLRIVDRDPCLHQVCPFKRASTMRLYWIFERQLFLILFITKSGPVFLGYEFVCVPKEGAVNPNRNLGIGDVSINFRYPLSSGKNVRFGGNAEIYLVTTFTESDGETIVKYVWRFKPNN
jgi:hypothetical protein